MAIRVDLKIKGIETFRANLSAGYTDFQAHALPEIAKSGARVVEAEAKKRAPVRTGFLRSAIKTSETVEVANARATAFVISHALYSKFLEYGTVRMAPRPFIRPALKQTALIMSAMTKAAKDARWNFRG